MTHEIPACWYSTDGEKVTNRLKELPKVQLPRKQCYCTACGSPINPHSPEHEHYIDGGNCECRVFEEM